MMRKLFEFLTKNAHFKASFIIASDGERNSHTFHYDAAFTLGRSLLMLSD